MNEVPLIQDVRKNDINTSIIAIKKQLKQLIEAVGLIESPNSPDMSPYVKKTDIVDNVQIGNQNPVTSNGVYVALTELEERIDENIVDNVENGDLRPVTSNAVSQAISYSTTEQKTGGVWIDGKPIYRKVVDFGNLPNATEKLVAHNISNIDKYTHIYGVALNSSNENTYPLPFGYPSSNNSIGLIANLTNVRINTVVNLSPLYAYVILEYTKTTD